MQNLISGSGNIEQSEPWNQQYRALGLPFDPLFRPDYVAHPTPSSAIHELRRTGEDTWNTSFTLEFPLHRRLPVQSQQPQVVVNYLLKNPSAAMDPTPIPIAQYAVNTGLIYVGPNAGTWGGIQVGTISGGPSGY